jgi:hypothetical protein
MNNCGRLFLADNLNAFYATAQRALVISAEVTLNPYSDHVQICRNPLEPVLPAPAVPEFMIVGTTRPGIHPAVVVRRTISASFPMEERPATVAVYSMGIDNPARVEVPVGSRPPQPSAQAAPIREPNLYDLQAYETRITYSTSSIAGVPQLSYQDQRLSLNFSGEEIRRLEAEIGSLVTVTLEQIPDLQTVTLTLLVPSINLGEGSTESPVQTVAIVTTRRTTIAGPQPQAGQVQTYRTLAVEGTAQLVAF